jgi:hypothetical protein
MSATDPFSQAKHSIWSMDVKELFEGLCSKMLLGSRRQDLKVDARTNAC